MSVTLGRPELQINARQGYHIDILRIGWYQGNGARVVSTLPTASLPQTRPACRNYPAHRAHRLRRLGGVGLAAVPSTAVSGL
jgi:hypothetical protein